MNPTSSKFANYISFHKQILQIQSSLVKKDSNQKMILLSGNLITDTMKIEKKHSFVNCVKKLFYYITFKNFDPFLSYKIEKVAQSLINELVHYQTKGELRHRDIACVGRIITALNLKTKSKHKAFIKKIFEEQFYNHLPSPKEKTKPLNNDLRFKKIPEQRSKPLRDKDVQNKNNNGLFPEDATDEEMHALTAKRTKDIEKFHKRRKFWSWLFGSKIGESTAGFSSENNI